LEQDFETHDSDIFGFAIDTYLDRQNGFMFAINPGGAIFDAQSFNDSRYTSREWEGIVHYATTVLPNGWAVEIGIPFTTLRFKASPEDQTWGINFVRRIRRLNEDSYWAPLARQHRVHRMSRAGTLTGLRLTRQGRNLSVKPYVKTGRVERPLPDGSDNSFDGGFDLKYGLTSRLTLDATVLTDFSQVEVDQEQVNLTRFSLFFPEKRDFFLENDGFFSLGDVSIQNYRTGSSGRDFRLFHSRRIGLSSDRTPLPIAGGVRLSGRAGDYELGLLEMQTELSDDGPAENFAVARVRRNLFGNSDVGAMFINRQRTSGGIEEYNRSFGADANFRLFRNMILSSYYARTDASNATGDRNAGYVQVAWRDRVFDTSAFVKHVGDGFDPGVGFIRRNAMQQGFATFGMHPQPDIAFLQEINPYVDVSFISDLDWELETRELTGGFATTFVDGGVLRLEYSRTHDRLDVPTPIAGATVPAGVYDFSQGSARYQASGARWLSGDVTVSHGDFYDGNRTSIAGSLTLRPDYHARVDLSVQHNDLTLGGQDLTADLYGVRLRTAFSTKVFTSAFVQYSNTTDELVANVRFNYLHSPLSDLFLVFTERRNVDLNTLIERAVIVKFTKLFGF